MTIEPFSTPERRPAADAAEARAITEGVRDALREHARTGILLARRVRRAHAARVWTALGYPSWEAYARAEFGVSRASAYRLLDMAVVLDQLDQAVADLGMSPFGDILEITRQQAREIKGRMPEVAAVLAGLLAKRGPGLEPAAVAELLSAAVDKVRKTPPRREITAGAYAQEQRKERFEYWLGTVFLDTAPAHLTDAEAAEALRAHDPELTSADLAFDLACRRYAAEGDPGPLNAYLAGRDIAPENPLPADLVGEGRRLTRRLRLVHWEAGKRALEVAPAHLSDRAAARALGRAFGLDPESSEITEKLAERRYAMTGDYRAIEEWEAEVRARP
jgi:hypothetical protein